MNFSGVSIISDDNAVMNSNDINKKLHSDASKVEKLKILFGAIEKDLRIVNEKLTDLSTSFGRFHGDIIPTSSTSADYQQILRDLIGTERNHEQVNQLSKCLDHFNEKLNIIQRRKWKCEQLVRDLSEMQNIHRKLVDSTSEAEDIVFLDVGGYKCQALVQTLTKTNQSIYISKLLAEKWDPAKNSENHRIFIDRDGELFKLILKYLRSSHLYISDVALQRELLLEAQFYGYTEMVRYLALLIQKTETQMNSSASGKDGTLVTYNMSRSPFQSTKDQPSSPGSSEYVGSRPFLTGTSGALVKMRIHPAQTAPSWRSTSDPQQLKLFLTSKLIIAEYEEKLIEFLNMDDQQKRKSWTLIYRASEHGFGATDFHQNCDMKFPTLCIIEADTGHIFGGYTSVPWSSSNTRSDQTDPTAFLFTLRNTIGVPPTKFPIAKEYENYAISLNPTCGPNFGSPNNNGSDICLRGNFQEKQNCIFFPRSYLDENNYGSQVFGRKNFVCKEVEVFSI